MTNLKRPIQNVLRKIVHNGLENACLAFSSFIKRTVKINQENLVILMGDFDIDSLINRTPGKQYVLSTNLIGELRGSSYLFFSDNEADEIFNYSPSKGVDKQQVDLFKEEFLKEIDNILSATVITAFSNCLDIQAYGGVPKIEYLNRKEIKERFDHQLSVNKDSKELFLVATSSFIIDGKSELQPYFIWRLEEKIIDLADQVNYDSNYC